MSGGISLDPDAQAFLNATGITDATITAAIDTLVTDLKGYGLWTKMKAIYPFVGGTATTHKFNLKNPVDSDAAFRLIFSGGWTHSANGALPNGSNAYADTYYNLSANSTTSNISAGFYSDSNSITSGVSFGATFGASFSGLNLTLKFSDQNTYWAANDSILSGVGDILSDTRGFFVINKITLFQKEIFKNGILLSSAAASDNLAPNLKVFLGARNTGSTSLYDTRRHSFTYFGDALSNTEAANLYTAVQAFQTTLGRQV